MRYYDISITDPKSGKRIGYWSTFPNGKNDPAAADVEIDIPVTAADAPMSGAALRIWGVSRDIIAEAKNWNPVNEDFTAAKQIVILGGMQKGLPLAMPNQAGTLCKGAIIQAFGNWIGTEMTLDLVFTVGPQMVQTKTPGGQTSPFSISLSNAKGVALSDLLFYTFRDYFPTLDPVVNLQKDYILASDVKGYYNSLKEFATYIRALSKSLNTSPDYPGIAIYVDNGQIIASDQALPAAQGITSLPTTTVTASAIKEILYTDLVGQITYIGTNTASITVIMRGDLKIQQTISLPKGQATVGPWYAYRNGMTFDGNWKIIALRHVGRLRNPSGMSWVTVITATTEVPNGG